MIKRIFQIFSALFFAPLAVLHPAAFGDTVLLDQNAFGTASRALPPNQYGLGADSTASPIAPIGREWKFITKPQLKSDANGLPSAYSLHSGKDGLLMVVPEAGNFRMNFAASNLNKPHINFRWRSEGQNYQLDLGAGTLTKFEDGKTTLLAQSKIPLFAVNGGAESWSAFEIIARNGSLQLRIATDGKSWQNAMECEDSTSIHSGAILLGAGKFGDVRVVSFPDAFKSRELPARGPEFEEALMTSMERVKRDPESKQEIARQNALEYLRHLAAPVPPEVSTALAVAQSDTDLDVRLAALRAIDTLQLKLDVPALLLDGLSSDKAAVRVGAVTGIINLKLPPEQIPSKVVDALMKDHPFARNNVKRLFFSMGAPLRAAVTEEIQDRYAKSADPRVKIALLRALGIDSVSPLIGAVDGSLSYIEEPMAEALPILGQALSDSSAEVRLAAIQTLRWIESPLAWVKNKKNLPPNIFRDHPEETAQIVKALKEILKSDSSKACRAEVVGCLAELRAEPETIIATLSDKEASVRSAAVQGLCNFDRAELQNAIPALQKLSSNAECKTDAAATLAYIQDEAVQAAIAGQKKMPLPSLDGLSPEDLLKETARRAASAAKLSLALQAERIPFPGDLFSHFSAQLCLQRNRVAANARLRQQLKFFALGDLAGLDGTKLPLVYALHYSKSHYFPGGLTPETEELFKQSMFSYVNWSSKMYFNDYVKDVTKLPGTENQSLQYRYGLWYMELAMLNEDPAYASRMLRGGKTVAQYYAEWNAYMKQWLRMKALNGFWIELGANYAGNYSMPALLTIYTVATDPETRQLAKMFIDLALVEEAQAGFGDVRGGSKNRIKDAGVYGAFDGITSMLYQGRTVEARGGHALVVSGYQAPAVAVLLRNFEQYPPQPILIENRRFGEVREDPARTYVADSGAVNYIWKTRHYMIGSMLRDPKTVMGGLYYNAPWNGIVFANGKGLFPATLINSSYYSFQHQNVLILRRDKPGAKEPMSVWISSGVEKVEENGWVFINAGEAYAGIKILAGGYSWGDAKNGAFLTLLPEVQTSPILIEGGDKDSFGSFDGFKSALQANTITVSANKVEYTGSKKPRIEFFFESTGKAPQVAGKPFSPDPQLVYSSPFLQRKEGESIVTVTVGGKRVIYDFDKATITEAGKPITEN